MKYLQNNGINFGEGGIISNTNHHHKSWYITESKHNLSLLNLLRKK